MNKIKCKYCGYIFSDRDIEEIKSMPNKIGYCKNCCKEINLNKIYFIQRFGKTYYFYE